MKKAISNFAKGLSDNSPVILTGLAACGVVGTVIFAVRATPKAMELIDEAKKPAYHPTEDSSPSVPELSKKDIIQVAWKPYVPALAMGSITIACIIGSNRISSRRNAALVSLYSIAETSLKEYQAKVVDTIGENKERKIRDEIDKERITNNPISNHVIIGSGENLCFDNLSGRYFKSDVETIRQKINEFNHRLLYENSMTLNELYYELNLDPIDMGNDAGWKAEEELVEVDFSTHMTDDNRPCIVMSLTRPTSIR